ncbi:creatininase family protein [Flavimaricola marinus]|uniref:Creatinine amidohydrolase n=1 Tax=Flavimaricola marinus TaxID=1819565 RepID=A0A238LKG2_9RHOB|nr:creatininase family protein [Flavimaricola marinus]SMY09446.1 Creatinine amidohydrolase [Flavimaricola marinus]
MPETKHLLSQMTFDEFAQRAAENPVILLPFGSHEEQGPHAPMGDYMLADRIAGMAAQRSGAIAAPTVPFGYADFFRSFAGGIQLRSATFKALVEDVATNFLDHGLTRLVIVNGHTTNAFLIDEVMRKLRRERGVLMSSINIWQCLSPADWTEIHGDNVAKARGHGGDPVTSSYMHLFPELLRPDLMRKAPDNTAFGHRMLGPSGISFNGSAVNMPLTAKEFNEDGMMGGDATHSSPEIGAKIVEKITAKIADFATFFAGCDTTTFTPTAPLETSDV